MKNWVQIHSLLLRNQNSVEVILLQDGIVLDL